MNWYSINTLMAKTQSLHKIFKFLHTIFDPSECFRVFMYWLWYLQVHTIIYFIVAKWRPCYNNYLEVRTKVYEELKANFLKIKLK